ncbi:hypothetical protein FRC11_012930 [Ceratobasidium sp. 423]|nr:hypothetical protein FRC11_012930 [Ceratobasidium sp. 423]
MYTHLPKADTSGLEPPPTSQLGLPVRKILVMGLTGAGKSTFINLVAGSTLAVGTSIHSCTQIPSHVSLRLEDGTTGEVMDTPGFDDSARSEFEVLENIIHELQSWAPEGVHAVIYIHRISDYKMPGSAIRAFDMFLKMCGSTDGVMSRVAIVTNMWGNISPALGEAREDELESNDALPFKNALKLGAKFHRNNNPPQSALKIVHALVGGESSFSEPVQLAIQKELAGGIPLFQTTAGEAISFEMARKRAEHEAEVKTLSRQYEQALEDHDIEARGEIEEERKLMEKKLEELERVEARLREQMKQAAPQADRGQVEQVTVTKGINVGAGGLALRVSGVLSGVLILSSIAIELTSPSSDLSNVHEVTVPDFWVINHGGIEVLATTLTPSGDSKPFAKLNALRSSDSDTRHNAQLRKGYVKLYAHVSPLTPAHIASESVDWNSTRAWFDECVKVSRYYYKCDGDHWTYVLPTSSKGERDGRPSDSYYEGDFEGWELQRERDQSLTLEPILEENDIQLADVLGGLDEIELVG